MPVATAPKLQDIAFEAIEGTHNSNLGCCAIMRATVCQMARMGLAFLRNGLSNIPPETSAPPRLPGASHNCWAHRRF